VTLLHYLVGVLSGVAVGFSLGLIGGGGSVLAVPLMVYAVGVSEPHVAIGTSALAVAINAASSLFDHARAGHVKWRCGGMFAAAGVAGAFVGSTLGKHVDGHRLLFLFALVMILIGVVMLRRRGDPGEAGVECTIERAPRVIGTGLLAGLFSGFFGIGGGFLIVPGLVHATGMPMLYAVGTSLVAVTAFGFTTAANYAASGLVDWSLASVFIGGGFVGSRLGQRVAVRLSKDTGRLSIAFAGIVFAVAASMLFKNIGAW
jgi:uncharacterized membrane protein YfcA